MEKIRKINSNENTEELCGFGIIKELLPNQHPLTETVKISEYREYTDNGLAGEWFYGSKKIKKLETTDLTIIEANNIRCNNRLKMVVNYN